MRVTPVPLRDAVTEWLADRESQGDSRSSLASARSFALRLAASSDAAVSQSTTGRRKVATTGDLTPAVMARYFSSIGGSQGNKNNCLTHIRHLLRYCERMSYIRKEGAGFLLGDRRAKPHSRRPKHYIDAADFPRLLDLAGDYHPEDRMVVAMGIYTLCRASEASSLRLQHIDLQARTINMWREKTDRWTEVPICDELMNELADWLGWYAEQMNAGGINLMIADHPDWHLMPARFLGNVRTPDGRWVGAAEGGMILYPARQMTRLERVVHRPLEAMGVKTLSEGMHTIRRSGARAMLDYLALTMGSDKALLQVSMMLDHSDTQTTLAYIGLDIERRQLHDYLRGGGSMYGAQARPTQGTVTRLPQRGAVRGREEPHSASGYRGVGSA